MLISPAAEGATLELCTRHATPATVEALRPTIVASAVALIDSAFMTKSLWFKSQPTHTFDSVAILDPKGEYLDSAVLHLSRESNAWLITSPQETPLRDTYPDERVVEEVRIHYFT